MKAEGNQQFKDGDYLAAMDTYTKALKICPLCFVKERSIMYSNRGACRFKRVRGTDDNYDTVEQSL